MRWSYRVGRLAGAEIRIHVTLILLLLVVGGVLASSEGVAAAAGVLVFLVLVFASVLLHELGHVVAARHYGISTPDIILLPIGGVARLRRIPRVPSQELAIAMAGPAVTLAVAAALFVILLAAGATEALGTIGGPGRSPAVELAARLCVANLILLGFNLLPAFPMDGGRGLRALLAMRMDYVAATRAASFVGQGFAVLFALVGIVSNPFLLLIALFVFVGARQESAAAEMQAAAAGLATSAAMMTDFRVFAPDATLGDAAEALLATWQRDFPVVDGEARVLGVLTRSDLVEALTAAGPEAPVASAMSRVEGAILTTAPLEEAYTRMQELRSPVLPVMDAEGRLVGLLTPENLGEMVMVRGALERAGRRFQRDDVGAAPALPE
jgi:Zn-dependent protease/CBS domain-containing protein